MDEQEKMNDLVWMCTWLKSLYLNRRTQSAIKLGTLDNPGWYLSVLIGTNSVGGFKQDIINFDRSEVDWVCCFLEGGRFECPGGLRNLSEMLYILRQWIENESLKSYDTVKMKPSKVLQRLSEWYSSNCDGDWEHCYGIHFANTEKNGWEFAIDFKETEIEDIIFDPINKKKQNGGWIECYVEEHVFKGTCGPENLEEAIKTFLDWTDV